MTIRLAAGGPISDLMAALAAEPARPDLFNPYAGAHEAAIIRRANLATYLREMRRRRPQWVLVGEALGYRGGRQTGIPFVSEGILIDGAPDLGLFGPGSPYRLCSGAHRPWREATATVVWRTLAALQLAPLLWNALAFHPHRPGEPLSNRPPRADELTRGGWFLVRVLALAPRARVIAVGRRASRVLTQLGVPHGQVRHPAHGGARAFQRELDARLRRRTGADE